MIPKLRNLILAAVVASAAPLASGCYVGDEPAAEYGYEPVYYDGALVYYDDYGRPFYYGSGGVVWITPGMPRYDFYVNHWRRYSPYYHRWYSHRGYRYRTYHAPYRGYGHRGGGGGWHGGYHGGGRRR